MDNTPYIESLALRAKNNEAIGVVITLQERLPGGSTQPVDLTGREFFAQAREGRYPDAPLLCDITVEVFGDPTEGKLRLSVPVSVIETLEPVKGAYDLLTRFSGGQPDNLYQAPFVIEQGVSQWTP